MAKTVNTFTDYTAEAADIDRRRKLAELLQQQALEPIKQETAGGYVVPISWTQGLAKALQGGVGAYKEAQAGKESKALTGRMRQEAQDWLSGMPQATTAEAVGSAADQAQFDMAPQMEQKQPTKQEMMSWALKGGLSGNPLAAQFASPFMAQAMKQDEAYTLAPGASRYGPGNTLIATAPTAAKTDGFTLNPGDARYDSKGNLIATATGKPIVEHNFSVGDNMVQPHVSFDGGLNWQPVPGSKPSAKFAKQVAPVVNQEAPVTPVTIADPKDPSKTVIVDGRSGKVIGAGPKPTASGAIEQKLSQSLPQAKLRTESITQNLDRLDSALAELDKNPGLSSITGTIMGRTPNFTNTATGAQAKLNSIKSQIFQSSLQAMREASKTGGAVGNVSDREGDKLERTLAALDQAQGTADFRKELVKAREQLAISKQLIRNAFDEQFGSVQGQSGSGMPSQSDIDAEIARRQGRK